MIISVDELTAMTEFSGQSAKTLERKLEAIESLIRSYTNNNFQNRHVRFEAESLGDRVFGTSSFLTVGDTVQITKSDVNDGLYVITEIDDNGEFIRLDKSLYRYPLNRVTKVEYPAVIQEGVINLLLWEIDNRQKVGIKQETLSRHSVTYYDQDATNSVMGYPKSLLGFLQPFMKARF